MMSNKLVEDMRSQFYVTTSFVLYKTPEHIMYQISWDLT